MFNNSGICKFSKAYRDQDETKTKTGSAKTKTLRSKTKTETKTQNMSLETSRDQDLGLENYITAYFTLVSHFMAETELPGCLACDRQSLSSYRAINGISQQQQQLQQQGGEFYVIV